MGQSGLSFANKGFFNSGKGIVLFDSSPVEMHLSKNRHGSVGMQITLVTLSLVVFILMFMFTN